MVKFIIPPYKAPRPPNQRQLATFFGPKPKPPRSSTPKKPKTSKQLSLRLRRTVPDVLKKALILLYFGSATDFTRKLYSMK